MPDADPWAEAMMQRDPYEDEDQGYDDEDEDEDDPFYLLGCDNPDCIMPGSHYRSECHTGEDMEAYYREMEDQEHRAFYVDVEVGGESHTVRITGDPNMPAETLELLKTTMRAAIHAAMTGQI